MTSELLERIEDRSITMPHLVAVRLAGQPVTYAQLAAEVSRQLPDFAVDAEVAEASLFAALMHLLPYRLRTTGPAEDVRIVSSTLNWMNAFHGIVDANRRLQSVG